MEDCAPRRAGLLAVLDDSFRSRVTELAALPREQATEQVLRLVYAHTEAWRILEEIAPQPDELRRLAASLDDKLVADELRTVADRAEASTG